MKKISVKNIEYLQSRAKSEIRKKLRREKKRAKRISPILIGKRKAILKKYDTISTLKITPRKRDEQFVIHIPRDFRMYNKTQNVMKVVSDVAKVAHKKQIKTVIIDHSKCEKHDLAAEVLLSSAVRCLKSIRTCNNSRFSVKGIYPQNKKMQKLLRSVGVVKENGGSAYHVKKSDELKIYRRESYPTEKINIFGKDKKTRVTEDFTIHLNNCLSCISAKLEAVEEEKLQQYLGEILSNAEEHSGEKLWQITSYLDSSDPNDIACEIFIFNIGKTVWDTFEEKRGNPLVASQWQNYVRKHIASLNEEQLTIVYALQQNASSKLDEAIDRGQGTRYLIELFHHFTNECNRINTVLDKPSCSQPNMFILSGKTMLKFDGTYSPDIAKGRKMVFAINGQNDLDFAPDSRYVPYFEDFRFPGTAIYINFTLVKSATDETS